MPELTGPQVFTSVPYTDGVRPMTLKKLRQMRRDPVIALVRFMFFAGIIQGEWSFEGEDEEQIAFIESQMLPIRRHILSTGALGCFDFGWQPYEKIFDVDQMALKINNERQPPRYFNSLRKLKPLIQDDTAIEEDFDTGAFLGFTNGNVTLDLEKCLLLNFDVEGTNWEGESTLENAEAPYDQGVTLREAVKRYDKKMAGAHWIVYYPDGNSKFNGEEVPNHTVAQEILQNLVSSGSIACPIGKTGFQTLQEQNQGWKIELITAGGGSLDFTTRFDYLDKSKARALGFPERSILEGLHGTKAEAESHGDFVLTMIEYRHDCLLESINWHLVNQLLRMNYGSGTENDVVIKAAPLSDSSKAMLSKIYDTILASPDGMLREFDRLDVESIAQTLGIPRDERDDDDVDELPENLPAPSPTSTPES